MSDNPMCLNANTYAWASSTSESDVTLVDDDANDSSIIIFNNTIYPVAVTSGKSAATAAMPTSATVPTPCTVVPAGAVVTMTKQIGHAVVSLIQPTADSGKYVYIQVGTGV